MTAASTPPATPEDPTQPVVARGASYYRRTRFIMVALILGFGLFFGYDGYYGWPQENEKFHEARRELAAAQDARDETAIARWSEEQKKYKERTDMDIFFQKVLFFTLPPLSLIVLAWALHNSRGEFRLANGTLSVPGHGDIPLTGIHALDKKLWDRKGIAYVHYTGDGVTRKFRLDDFIYDAHPTREIVKRIEASLHERGAVESAEPSSQPVNS